MGRCRSSWSRPVRSPGGDPPCRQVNLPLWRNLSLRMLASTGTVAIGRVDGGLDTARAGVCRSARVRTASGRTGGTSDSTANTEDSNGARIGISRRRHPTAAQSARPHAVTGRCAGCAGRSRVSEQVGSSAASTPTQKPLMTLNPEPLGIAQSDDERAISSLMAWRRSATRTDRLRVWLALGGTREDFDAENADA